ncbi:MAG: DUF4118 domain-containing protein, partial [Ktedonobacteraceae bacterium]|nr:DUF4118 domain-containing protein [Ktedonobacteraceae bacterium]
MASSETSGTGSKKQKHPVALVRLQQSAQRRRRYVAQLPWWRHPLIGYAMSVLGVALGLLIMFLEHYFFPPVDFPGSVLLLPVLFIALFWGVGPALVAVLLST